MKLSIVGTIALWTLAVIGALTVVCAVLVVVYVLGHREGEQ